MEIVKNADCFRFREMFFFYKLEIEVLEFSDRTWYSKATGKRENLKGEEEPLNDARPSLNSNYTDIS